MTRNENQTIKAAEDHVRNLPGLHWTRRRSLKALEKTPSLSKHDDKLRVHVQAGTVIYRVIFSADAKVIDCMEW